MVGCVCFMEWDMEWDVRYRFVALLCFVRCVYSALSLVCLFIVYLQGVGFPVFVATLGVVHVYCSLLMRPGMFWSRFFGGGLFLHLSSAFSYVSSLGFVLFSCFIVILVSFL